MRSATPITSAMASRVMSSWVGPSPPQQIDIAAPSEGGPQRGHDAAVVVADLGLLVARDARGPPGARLSRPNWCLLTWPSSSSVPIARTSQSTVLGDPIRRWRLGRRSERESTRY